MSDPPTTSSEPAQQHHHHIHQQLLHLPLSHGGGTISTVPATTRMNNATSSSTVVVREYRKGNWTLQETMILITAKKLDDERRNRVNLAPADPSGRKGGELRWKWVENYCWSHGCQRSQNQCNDKWDNLLRDYKKVREYESKSEELHSQSHSHPFPDHHITSTSTSYWKLEKHQRKDKNLPSNLAFEVYQALNDVVQRKYSHRPSTTTTSSAGTGDPHQPHPFVPLVTLPPLLRTTEAAATATTTTTTTPAVSESSSSGTESGEKDHNNMQESSKRRRRRRRRRSREDDNGGGDDDDHQMSSSTAAAAAIERSASMLAHTIRSCEEQREIRHQQLIDLYKRRLHIEETRNQLHRQGLTDLLSAIANLSSSDSAPPPDASRPPEGYGGGIGCNLYNTTTTTPTAAAARHKTHSRAEDEDEDCEEDDNDNEVTVLKIKLKEQNEAMQSELLAIKTELSQLRDQMPNIMHTMMHNIIHHNIHHNNPPPTSISQPPHPNSISMDPTGSGGGGGGGEEG